MTKTLAIAGTVMLAMGTCCGTAASPDYDAILSVTIILALGALICFRLVFLRVRKRER